MVDRYVTLQERVEAIGPPWKSGNEFLPYHPSASHVSAEHRDGWNWCYLAYLAAAPKPALTSGRLGKADAELDAAALRERILALPLPAPEVRWDAPMALAGGGYVSAATYYTADQMRALLRAAADLVEPVAAKEKP